LGALWRAFSFSAAEKFLGEAIAGASTASAVRMFGGIWERLDFALAAGGGGAAELRSAWTGEGARPHTSLVPHLNVVPTRA